MTPKEYSENVSIIEKELKDKEDYDKLCEDFQVSFPQLREALVLYKCFDIEENNKKLQALEIIKSKPQMEISLIAWHKIKTYEEYLKKIGEWDEGYGDLILTQEEYDLLKEVLL